MTGRVTRLGSVMRGAWLVSVWAVVGCSVQGTARHSDSALAGSPSTVLATGSSTDLPPSRLPDWRPPSLDSVGDNPDGASIRRGLALMMHTRDSLPADDGSTLNCTSCHLDAGRHQTAIPLMGVHGIYPEYNSRADAVVPIEDRINYCFTRSLSGSRVATGSREMRDIVSYLEFLSRGVPGGSQPYPGKLLDMPPLLGDSGRGGVVFGQTCARCHGGDGAGTSLAPALWGARSFSIAASLARVERGASFIRYNMPFDKPGSLTDQQAFDVAAFVASHPRPDMPGKERDWPRGDAPADVPYQTVGHQPAHPPQVLPRANASRALVPLPGAGGT
jgi:thiosulfate dehydrogenase